MGRYALFVAACPSHFKFLAYLIEVCDLEVNSVMKDGITPLFIAMDYYNNIKTITYLLDHGVNPSTETCLGDTPLKKAIRVKNPELIKLLIVRGADVHAVDKVRMITLIMQAVECSDFETVKQLKDLGCNINVEDKFGDNCVSRVILKRNMPMLQKLM